MQDTLEQLQSYFDSDDELEIYLRMNYEWNEESFQKLKSILLGMCDEDRQSELFQHYNGSLKRIVGTMRNPLFTRTKSEEDKAYIQGKIGEVETLRRLLYRQG